MSTTSEQQGVPSSPHSGMRILITVTALLLLGLAAYGFGFSLAQPQLANHPFVPAETAPSAPSIVAAVCNNTPSAKGGGGRCYSGCAEDADCAATTSSQETCAALATVICNGSAVCIAQICGPDTVLCFQGFCTRPNLERTEAQCATPATAGVGNVCNVETRTCTRDGATCAATKDCVQPTLLSGKWIGLCPAKTSSAGVPVANCTEQDVSACRIRDASEAADAPAANVNQQASVSSPAVCLFQPGRCGQVCIQDSECPARSVETCRAQATAQCTPPGGTLDQTCYTQAMAVCTRPPTCVTPVGEPLGRCSEPLPAVNYETLLSKKFR